MLDLIARLLSENGIRLFAPIPLSACRIQKPHLLTRAGLGAEGTAVMFAIPYHTPACETEGRNISRYAVSPDYHTFASTLAERLLPPLREAFPNVRFALFADHSPIDERHAAARAGLGIIGRHGLLITEPYSSYIFIGELITDACLPASPVEISGCENCGACLQACPMERGEIRQCLSALTQKKGTLDETETAALIRYGTVWGCDRCQEVCPHTREALRRGTLSSPIEFFHSAPLPHLTYDRICRMTDSEFSTRAYAWRGREVILRNLAITESENGDGQQTKTNKS